MIDGNNNNPQHWYGETRVEHRPHGRTGKHRKVAHCGCCHINAKSKLPPSTALFFILRTFLFLFLFSPLFSLSIRFPLRVSPLAVDGLQYACVARTPRLAN